MALLRVYTRMLILLLLPTIDIKGRYPINGDAMMYHNLWLADGTRAWLHHERDTNNPIKVILSIIKKRHAVFTEEDLH